MKNIIITPPIGIQQTYIGLTQVGNVHLLYDIEANEKMKNLSGAGTNTKKEHALELSEYEALERIANSINCRSKVIDTYKNMNNQAVNLEKFPKLSTWEEGININSDANQSYTWVECIDLMSGQKKFIPQNFVYLYGGKQCYGDRITNPISTGAALHEDYISATINGIYEVLERDAIALTWLLKRVKGEVTHLFNEEEKKVFHSSFLGEVKFYDVSTMDGVITVCAHAKSQHSKRCKNVLMFCSSTSFSDIKKKLKKELISVMFSFYTNTFKYSKDTNVDLFNSVEQGGSFMARDFNDKSFDFFKNVPLSEIHYEKKKFISKKEELKYLINILKESKMSLYVVDISCREVTEKGYRAVKVIIPEAQPISFVHRSRYLASERFINIAKQLYGENYIENINHMPLAFS